MAWTAPKTWAVGDVLTASDLNTYNRDNLTALQPQQATVSTQQTTTATSYPDLGTVGPAVTLTTGTSVLVDIGAFMTNTGSAGIAASSMAVAVSGATTIAAPASQVYCAIGATGNNPSFKMSYTGLVTGLTAGSNTFTAKYQVSAGTGTFAERCIVVTACF